MNKVFWVLFKTLQLFDLFAPGNVKFWESFVKSHVQTLVSSELNNMLSLPHNSSKIINSSGKYNFLVWNELSPMFCFYL